MAGGGLVVRSIPPGEASFYPRCQLHTLTGLHCPGCGATRSLHALFNGRVEQALAYNALVLVFLPAAGCFLVAMVWNRYRGWSTRRSLPRAWDRYGLWMLVFAVAAYGILRNIPVYPLTLLAPHEL